MEELREQLVFQDHLVAAVRDWKNQITAELKSDKNILFIGVHCRNDRPPYTFSIDSHHCSGGRITSIIIKDFTEEI